MEKTKTYTSAKQTETSFMMFLLPIVMIAFSYNMWPYILKVIPNMLVLFIPIFALIFLMFSKDYRKLCRNFTRLFIRIRSDEEMAEEDKKTLKEQQRLQLENLYDEVLHTQTMYEHSVKTNSLPETIHHYAKQLKKLTEHMHAFMAETGLKLEIKVPTIKKDYTLAPNCHGCGSNDWKHNKCSYCGGTH